MNNKFIWMIVGLVIGAIVTCAIFWLCCGYCKESCKKSCKESCAEECTSLLPGVKEVIDDPTAHAYFLNYLKAPIIMVPDTFKAFMVNREQLSAMNMLIKDDTAKMLFGFRIYRGATGDPKPISLTMIVGVGKDSSDRADKVYSAGTSYSGPCPPNCDKNGPIK
jgi:hypothetical protein